MQITDKKLAERASQLYKGIAFEGAADMVQGCKQSSTLKTDAPAVPQDGIISMQETSQIAHPTSKDCEASDHESINS